MKHIKPKQFYIERWILTYLTRYQGSTIRELQGAQSQYTNGEIAEALEAMQRAGTVRREGICFYARLLMAVRS